MPGPTSIKRSRHRPSMVSMMFFLPVMRANVFKKSSLWRLDQQREGLSGLEFSVNEC